MLIYFKFILTKENLQKRTYCWSVETFLAANSMKKIILIIKLIYYPLTFIIQNVSIK